MLMEHYILIALWLIGIAIFMLFIPRTHLREALLSLMVFQAVIWLFNIPAFLFGLVSAPIREFPKAHDLPITLNYFFYPV